MKRKICILVLSVVLCSSQLLFSQDYSKLKDIQLVDKTDYPPAEEKVLECSRYILTTPMNPGDINRLYAAQFMIRWMEGTPDFSFTLDGSVGKILKGNQDLLPVILASMVNYVLENRENAANTGEVKFNSMVKLIDYCEKPENKVALDKELKKLIKARKENKLKEYLNS